MSDIFHHSIESDPELAVKDAKASELYDKLVRLHSGNFSDSRIRNTYLDDNITVSMIHNTSVLPMRVVTHREGGLLSSSVSLYEIPQAEVTHLPVKNMKHLYEFDYIQWDNGGNYVSGRHKISEAFASPFVQAISHMDNEGTRPTITLEEFEEVGIYESELTAATNEDVVDVIMFIGRLSADCQY